MQPTFLDHIAGILLKEYGDRLQDIQLVVPNKRAVVFLKKALANAYQKTIWAPDIVAVQEFFRRASSVKFPEPLVLILELYECYREEARRLDPAWDESLESFFSWGEMLLRDFDEVDKYLIPADQLFSNISDLREIDTFFSLPEEDRAALEHLWQAVRGNKKERKELEEKFLTLWSLMYPVYAAFRERLQSKGFAYDGMACRELANNMQQQEAPFNGQTCIFIGFNALLGAEEKVIGNLLERQQATVFWDVHTWYFHPEGQTPVLGKGPGKFIREYHQKWSENGLDSRLVFAPNQPTTIHLVGAPQHIGQTRYLGLELAKVARELALKVQPLDEQKKSEAWSRQAVVLANERLLFPALKVLPKEAVFPNVTMGYPLNQTHVYQLIDTIISLLRNRQEHPEHDWVMGHQDVKDLFLHPYLQDQFPQGSDILREMARTNQIVLPANRITRKDYPELVKTIFKPPSRQDHLESIKEVLSYLDDILHQLLTSLKKTGKLELEFLLKLRDTLTMLGNTLTSYHSHIRTDALGRLLSQALSSIRIPFEGEPLEGLQIMGFLETRGLDFERSFILGANEGLLPDTSSGHSFIPYLLRKGFGMPTFEEKDAIYAYHFYRFLQRNHETWLIYNRVISDGNNSREMSRFIQQIRFFLKDYPQVTVVEHQANAPAQIQARREIRISMTQELRDKLYQRFFVEGALSPSALNTYRKCSLRFYFRYLAGLKEEEEVEQKMPNNLFGTLLHHVLEQAYQTMGTGKELQAETILDQQEQLEPYLLVATRKANLSKDYLLQGENLLKRRALLQQSRQLLREDARSAPFTVVGTEEDIQFPGVLKAGGVKFKLKGTLDRIDKVGDTIRILDYKTGNVEVASSLDMKRLFSSKGKDQDFQGLTYALLYASAKEADAVQVGFYGLRKPGSGITYLMGGALIRQDTLRSFEEELLEMLNHIASEDFSQTEDEKQCRYCPYAGICQRNIG